MVNVNVADVLKAGKKKISFEICPPKFGKAPERAYEVMDKLIGCDPGFVSMTYHQETTKFVRDSDNGGFRRIVGRTKAGTYPLCALLEARYDLPIVQHLICAGFSKKETADVLKEMAFVKLWNVLALRGDPKVEEGEKSFNKHPEGHGHASDLVEQITSFNEGRHSLGDALDQIDTQFCIGVAGYPEKHVEAPNFDYDLRMLKAKVDKGASYIITQMFFDNNAYFDFVARAREAGITVPIIPGVNPLLSMKDVELVPKIFGVSIPDSYVSEFEGLGANKEAAVVCLTKQCEGLLKHGVPDLHFYTEGRDSKINIVAEVYHRLFGRGF